MITRKSSFVIGAIVALTLGSGSAYAATGGNMFVGQANSAKKTTTVSNTKGTPLALNAKRGYAPLKVNSNKLVVLLNADQLDGVSAGSFLRTTGKAADADKLDGLSSESFLPAAGKAADADKLDGIDATSFALATAGTGYVSAVGAWSDFDADGFGDALIAVATCPAGSKLTGGGVDNFAVFGTGTLSNSPSGNAWFGAALADQLNGDLASDVESSAICFNPRGPVAGAVSTTSAATASPQSSSDVATADVKAALKKAWLASKS